MIGQKQNKIQIKKMIDEFPRFVLIVGPEGSGKKTLAKYISEQLNAVFIQSSNDVETVRNVRTTAYKTKTPMVICFSDIQEMSSAAKNALLKVIEEVPNNVYFVMTTTSGVIDTIRSRAMSIYMEPYSSEELIEYCELKSVETAVEVEMILEIATVPGDIDKLVEYNIGEFYDYVHKVVDKLHKVSGANSFKIADKLKLTKEGTGWEIQLFFKAIMQCYLSEMKKTHLMIYNSCIVATSFYLDELNIKGINKEFLIDNWILTIRKIWRTYGSDS